MQHDLGLAADVGVRQFVEQSEGEVYLVDKAGAMKAAVEKKVVALRMKMGKFVDVSNPKLTDGWFREVRSLNLCPYYFVQFILRTGLRNFQAPYHTD